MGATTTQPTRPNTTRTHASQVNRLRLKLDAAMGKISSQKSAIDKYRTEIGDLRRIVSSDVLSPAQTTSRQLRQSGERISFLQAKVDEYMAADKAAKDAEKMDSLKGVAAKLGVKLDDGVDLPAARRAIAATQVAELRADASDAYIDALVDVAAGKSAAVKSSRYDAWGAKPRPGAQRTDAASVPYVDAWSHHDSAHTQTHGGAK